MLQYIIILDVYAFNVFPSDESCSCDLMMSLYIVLNILPHT